MVPESTFVEILTGSWLSTALSYGCGVDLQLVAPGKPAQNGYIENVSGIHSLTTSIGATKVNNSGLKN